MKDYFFDMYIHQSQLHGQLSHFGAARGTLMDLDDTVRRRRREAVEQEEGWEREREGGEGQVRSDTLFLFWAQLSIEHAVARYQNHMAVLRNDYITIGYRMRYAKKHLK